VARRAGRIAMTRGRRQLLVEKLRSPGAMLGGELMIT
jgi:hypothetical protein